MQYPRESNPKRTGITLYRKTQSLSRLQLILIPEEYDDVVSDLVAESSLT